MKLEITIDEKNNLLQCDVEVPLDGEPIYRRGPGRAPDPNPNFRIYRTEHIKEAIEKEGYKLEECISDWPKLKNNYKENTKGTWIFRYIKEKEKQKNKNVTSAKKRSPRKKTTAKK